MKSKLTKITFLTYLLLTNFILFAQDDDITNPGGNGDGGTVTGGDTPTGPIDSEIIWLLLLGLAFAYYLYKTKKVKA